MNDLHPTDKHPSAETPDLSPSTGDSAAPFAARLREFTPARVGLGRTGVSQTTRDVLAFQLSHAQARDAVHARLEAAALAARIGDLCAEFGPGPVVRLHSAAADRTTYLQRPDLGRRLDQGSRDILAGMLARLGLASYDLALIIADGLSALAVERHVPPLLAEFLPSLTGCHIGPICVVEQARVAIGDEIGSALGAALSLVLIGERPGLSSPDSLGAYVTWQPRPGRTDAERNCISNIRAEGLGYRQAADQLVKVLTSARRHQLTGTALENQSRQLERSSE